MKHSYKLAYSNLRLPAIAAALALSALASHAQLKTGSNPSVLSANVNFEVEATNGHKAVISKDLGFLGIGTSAPGSALSILSEGSGVGADDIAIYSFGAPPQMPIFSINTARGTQATPLPLQAGDTISTSTQNGYVNGAFKSLSYMSSFYRGDGTTLTTSTHFYLGNLTGTAIPLTLWGDKVGINQANPTEAFHISGGNLRYDHPSKGAGKFLTSDANGVASWSNGFLRTSTPQYILSQTTLGASFTNNYIAGQMLDIGNGYIGNNVTQAGLYAVQVDFYEFGTITGRYFVILQYPDGSKHYMTNMITPAQSNTRYAMRDLFYLQPGLYKILIGSDYSGAIEFKCFNSAAHAVNVGIESL